MAKQIPADAVRVMAMMYPNKAVYHAVFCGADRIGSIEETPRGYVPIGLRKPSKTIEDAAIRCIQRRISNALGEAAKFARMLELPVSADAVASPVGKATPVPSRIQTPEDEGAK